MTRMRFCSSRLSYSLARWVLMMGSSLSSALYSVRACRHIQYSICQGQKSWSTEQHADTSRISPFQSLLAICSFWPGPHISLHLSGWSKKTKLMWFKTNTMRHDAKVVLIWMRCLKVAESVQYVPVDRRIAGPVYHWWESGPPRAWMNIDISHNTFSLTSVKLQLIKAVLTGLEQFYTGACI